MKIPNTIFFKTASTLVITLLLLSIIILASTAYFVLVPVGKRSADDLAALLVLSAQTWTELPPETRPDFEKELITAHGIKLLEAEQPLEAADQMQFFIYRNLLQQALERRLGETSGIIMGVDAQYPEWIWLDIPIREQTLRFGFSKHRIGARPPVVFLAVLIAIAVLAVSAALIIALRLARPLALLSAATTAVGRGEKKSVSEDNGPDEIITLARNFNQMSREVSELLENRTTLLAGISHDLRTPLTRIRLALEINTDAINATLRSNFESDVEDMEQLLEQALLLAQGVDKKEQLQERDLVKLLSTLVAQIEAEWQVQHPDSECQIEFQADDALNASWLWPLPEQSLLRVLHNLIENSVRYGDNNPITIQLAKQGDYPLITILDRGPGIPKEEREAVFRPFYRLEESRNLMTGGSGLGLAIVRQLCQAQGWEITLHPRIGGGTEVRLLLSS
ncbi:MAG: HAMP domain-containing protein [Sulfuriflexus sp.]|nr:HAMP domain-containing protein [Sulfuriflexus sp.]